MKLFALRCLFVTVLLSLWAGCVGAASLTFSQEMIGVRPNGISYDPVHLEPQSFKGMKSLRFDLGKERKLEIRTNMDDPRERGVEDVAAVVRRCYGYLEGLSGKKLKAGVLLYLVEMDRVPPSYLFEASIDGDGRWSEVRLCLLSKGEKLLGPGGSESLAELLYDTLPHELGHDILGAIDVLPHDAQDLPSYRTRWFIEGVCEVLAKGFSQIENCPQRQKYLHFRRVDSVMDDPMVTEEVFSWAQENGNEETLESDLYGAAMLLVMTWVERMDLADLLASFQRSGRILSGEDLIASVERKTGLSRKEAMARAAGLGRELGSDAYYSGWYLPKPLAGHSQSRKRGT